MVKLFAKILSNMYDVYVLFKAIGFLFDLKNLIVNFYCSSPISQLFKSAYASLV
jgi:hypothetical protein